MRAVRLIPTGTAETMAWVRPDTLRRLLPFFALPLLVWLIRRPAWIGFGAGEVRAQLMFAAIGAPALFAGALAVQLALSRRRGALRVPAGGAALALELAFYAGNAVAEEAFFRGLIQGGMGQAVTPLAGFGVATAFYVLYHRLGGWAWSDVAATALLGVPLGLAFWLLPGPPSLLGVTLAHFGATAGFLGGGPWLLARRLT